MVSSETCESSDKMDPILQILDYWTEVSIEAHWKELVKEAKEADNTGETIHPETS